MKRCLKMIVNAQDWQTSWSQKIQDKAKKLEIEGLMQMNDDKQLRIMVCGEDENLDNFIDYLYDLLLTIDANISELEPFIKERDYRGIFRVI